MTAQAGYAGGLSEYKQQAHSHGGELNHLDRMDVAFHRRVIAGYRALIAAEPGRWRVIDAGRPAEQVQASLRQALGDVLPSGR